MKRFYDKVQVNYETGCHEWTGARSQKGYGRLSFGGKNRHAHRIGWVLKNGPILPSQWVLHKCDNPLCVNPDHLFLGDSITNVRDMIAKGRQAPAYGEFGSGAILTEAQVKEIRKMPINISHQRRLASLYGVKIVTIKAVQYRRNWRHI